MTVTGVVQGVGFRPFVYRLAAECSMSGSVRNTVDGVRIQLQGEAAQLANFRRRLHAELPRLARIDSARWDAESPVESSPGVFEILESEPGTTRAGLVTPDAGPCDACLADMRRVDDRRLGYPLTNCTDCGPRYTILDGLPYDRAKTAMSMFRMCEACETEYQDPANRRHHAQPNSCWSCGPQLRLLALDGQELAPPQIAIAAARERLLRGDILSIKGVGGYHLVADARNDAAVARLRSRKRRPTKPFALLVRDVETARRLCQATTGDENLLTGPGRPIVLLPMRPDGLAVSPLVAPGLGELGLMLPSAPLHDLLLTDDLPIVIATSANVSGRPIIFEDEDALVQLSGIVDAHLTHNRPIRAGLDDSVLRSGRDAALGPVVVRRARGLAPMPLRGQGDARILALGADLKATVALSRGPEVFVSEQVGDLLLDSVDERQEHTARRLMDLLGVQPTLIACDLHPQMSVGRQAARLARALDVPLIRVQHHHAHVAAAMLDRALTGPVLGVVLDGFGYGLDGTAWGGEFLLGDRANLSRVGHFRPVRLPGGDRTATECDRVALALLVDAFGADEALVVANDLALRPPEELQALAAMCVRNFRCLTSSAAGRLFDGAAALLGLCQRNSFEAEAPMKLEACALGGSAPPLPFDLEGDIDGLRVDLRPSIRALARRLGGDRAELARAFQATIVEATAVAAIELCHRHQVSQIVLTGGVFNNLYVRDHLADRLARAGLSAFAHQDLPPGDGCIAAGQVAALSARFSN